MPLEINFEYTPDKFVQENTITTQLTPSMLHVFAVGVVAYDDVDVYETGLHCSMHVPNHDHHVESFRFDNIFNNLYVTLDTYPVHLPDAAVQQFDDLNCMVCQTRMIDNVYSCAENRHCICKDCLNAIESQYADSPHPSVTKCPVCRTQGWFHPVNNWHEHVERLHVIDDDFEGDGIEGDFLDISVNELDVCPLDVCPLDVCPLDVCPIGCGEHFPSNQENAHYLVCTNIRM